MMAYSMTFSRLRFYRGKLKLKPCISQKAFSAQLDSQANDLSRVLQCISRLCTYCALRKDGIDTKGEDVRSDNNAAELSDMTKLDEEIKATKKAHRKALAEKEMEFKKGKRYSGRYKHGGARHVPVLLDEVLDCFKHLENKTILDMTFGSGGHSKALLERMPGSHILALDRDPTAHQQAQELARTLPGTITPLLGRFSDVPQLLASHGVKLNSIGGVLMDLGTSSMQFDHSERGFSLSMNGPLDMRMDMDRMDSMPTAADVVNSLEEKDLALILKKYGEEKRAADIAHGIVEARSAYGRIATTHQLADIVEAACRGGYGLDKLGRPSHPATKTFQALRIFVNNELNELDIGLWMARKFLQVGGVCVSISFHSLEEKLVKRHFYDVHMEETHDKYFQHRPYSRTRSGAVVYSVDEMEKLTERNWRPFDNGAFTPSSEEVLRNPRSRSAVMYAAEKIV